MLALPALPRPAALAALMPHSDEAPESAGQRAAAHAAALAHLAAHPEGALLRAGVIARHNAPKMAPPPAVERILCGTAREVSHPWIRPLLAEANKLRREFGGDVVITLARNPLSGVYTTAVFAMEMTPELAARYRAEADELARERAESAALLERHRENAGLTYEDVLGTEAA